MPPSEPLTFWRITLQKLKRELYEFHCLPNDLMPEEQQSPISPDTTLPIPLRKDNTHVPHQHSHIHVCIYQERLGYVISLPSVQKRTFFVVRMILICVPVDQENFLHIELANSIL